MNDLNVLTAIWLDTGKLFNADFDRDSNINLVDFALLAKEWLEITTWY